MSPKFRNFVGISITLVWVTSFLADIVSTSYEPSPYLHAIMMIVAGAVFTGGLIKNGSGEKK